MINIFKFIKCLRKGHSYVIMFTEQWDSAKAVFLASHQECIKCKHKKMHMITCDFKRD